MIPDKRLRIILTDEELGFLLGTFLRMPTGEDSERVKKILDRVEAVQKSGGVLE